MAPLKTINERCIQAFSTHLNHVYMAISIPADEQTGALTKSLMPTTTTPLLTLLLENIQLVLCSAYYNTKSFVKFFMVGHRGLIQNSISDSELLPQTVGNTYVRAKMDGEKTQHVAGDLFCSGWKLLSVSEAKRLLIQL